MCSSNSGFSARNTKTPSLTTTFRFSWPGRPFPVRRRSLERVSRDEVVLVEGSPRVQRLRAARAPHRHRRPLRAHSGAESGVAVSGTRAWAVLGEREGAPREARSGEAESEEPESAE